MIYFFYKSTLKIKMKSSWYLTGGFKTNRQTLGKGIRLRSSKEERNLFPPIQAGQSVYKILDRERNKMVLNLSPDRPHFAPVRLRLKIFLLKEKSRVPRLFSFFRYIKIVLSGFHHLLRINYFSVYLKAVSVNTAIQRFGIYF